MHPDDRRDPIIPAEDERLRTLPWYKTPGGAALITIAIVLSVAAIIVVAMNVGEDDACTDLGGLPSRGNTCEVDNGTVIPVVEDDTVITEEPDTIVVDPPDTLVPVTPDAAEACVADGGTWDGAVCALP